MYMKKSVNFEKKDIVKILIKEKAQDNINKIDYENNAMTNCIKEYFYEYIEPILIELDKQKIVEYKPNEINSQGITRRTYFKAIGYIRGTFLSEEKETKQLYKEDFKLYGMDKYRLKCDDEGIFFLQSKNINLRKEYAEIIKKAFITEYKITDFSKNYIKPLIPLIKKTEAIKDITQKHNFNDKFIDFAIEALFMAILKYSYFCKNIDIINKVNSNNEDDKKQLTTFLFNVFLRNNNEDSFTKIYEEYTYDDTNKYNHSDYNDYYKYITKIFNI